MDNIVIDWYKEEIDPMNIINKKQEKYLQTLERENKILRNLVDGFMVKDDTFLKRFKKFCKIHKQIKAGIFHE